MRIRVPDHRESTVLSRDRRNVATISRQSGTFEGNRGGHRAGRQQDRMRDTAQKKQGRHVLPVDAHAEVQTELGAVAGFDSSNRLSARHRFAC